MVSEQKNSNAKRVYFEMGLERHNKGIDDYDPDEDYEGEEK